MRLVRFVLTLTLALSLTHVNIGSVGIGNVPHDDQAAYPPHFGLGLRF